MRRRCRGRDRRARGEGRHAPLRSRSDGDHVSKGKPADLAYECVLDEAAFARWREGDSRRAARRVRHRDDEPRPDGRADRRAVVRDRARRRRATCRSRIATPARPTSSTASTCSRRCARLVRRSASARKVGQNVKYDEHALANHGIALAGVAHDTLLESYVLEAHRPHDMDSLAWRHLDWKTIAYSEVAARARAQIGFDQVRGRPRDRVFGRGCRRHAAPARGAVPAGRRGREACRTSTTRSSCRCATCSSGWSATAC